MRPPASTKPAVYQWNLAVTNVTDELGKILHAQNRWYCGVSVLSYFYSGVEQV